MTEPATEPDADKTCPTCGRHYDRSQKFCPEDGATLRAAAADGLVGQVVADRYHVLRKLGEGGMGQVYLAEHVRMKRRSALKIMHASMAQDADAIIRFNREAEHASRVSHPNVAQIYDFGETADGMIYLAMELVEGEPLRTLLEREGALLPLDRAAEVIRQAAEGLAAAHQLGIVHRDLKPDNVMVAPSPDGGDLVKLVDFGIARGVDAGERLTRTGLVIGTPDYMSPEQVVGDRLDGRSDLYALALVAFNVLTGQLPFRGRSTQETLVLRLTQAPRTLAETRPDVAWPAALQAVLDRALAREPDDRYDTAREFGRAFAAAAGGQEVVLTGSARRLPPPSATATPAAGAPLVTPAAVAAPGVEIASPAPVAPATGGAEAPRSRGRVPLAGAAAGALVAAVVAGVLWSGRGDGAATAVAPGVDAPVVGASGTGSSTTAPDAATTAPAGDAPTPPAVPAVPGAGGRDLPGTAPATAAAGRPAAPGGPPARPAPPVVPSPVAAGSRAVVDVPPGAPRATPVGAPVAAAPAAAAPTPPAPAAAEPAGEGSRQAELAAARANAAAEARRVVDEYVRALATRDVADLRRVYPSMPAAEAQGWRDLFEAADRREYAARATSIGAPDVADDARSVRVSFGVRIDFRAGGARQSLTPSYQASLVRDGAAWRIASLRATN